MGYKILLLLFDNLRTAPPRLSTKLTIVATIPNAVAYIDNHHTTICLECCCCCCWSAVLLCYSRV